MKCYLKFSALGCSYTETLGHTESLSGLQGTLGNFRRLQEATVHNGEIQEYTANTEIIIEQSSSHTVPRGCQTVLYNPPHTLAL